MILKAIKQMGRYYSVNVSALLMISGFVTGFGHAVMKISTNRYFELSMHRMTLSAFQESVSRWFFISIFISAGIFILGMILDAMQKQIIPDLLSIHIEKKKVSLLIYHISLCALFFTSIGLCIEYFIPFLKSFYLHYLFYGPLLALVFFGILTAFKWFSELEILRKVSKVVSIVLILVVAVLNISVFFVRRQQKKDFPNIILISVDCLRPDHLGCYGYQRNTSPNIDRLAENGVMFNQVYASSSWTKPSVASLFTGLYPNQHHALGWTDVLSEQHLTFTEVMKENGYRMLFFNGGNEFITQKFHFDQGFDHYFHFIDQTGQSLTDRFLSVMHDSGKQPFFAYLHYMDVHLPYREHDRIHQFTDSTGTEHIKTDHIKLGHIRSLTRAGELSDQNKTHIVNLYDGQIRFVDDQIGRIIRLLEERKLADHTIVVITADHGEELWDHGGFEHGHTLYQELIRVPLIILYHNLGKGVIGDPVRQFDLFPTFCSMVDLDVPTMNHRGRDLLPAISGEKIAEPLPAFAMGMLYGNDKYGIIDHQYKLILNCTDKKEQRDRNELLEQNDYELYHLKMDPTETVSLKMMKHNRFQSLRDQLTDAVVYNQSFLSPAKTKIDPALEERLKSLGYIK